MTKDEKGIWSVTVGPFEPDMYTYKFNVDGVSMIDPQTHTLTRLHAVVEYSLRARQRTDVL